MENRDRGRGNANRGGGHRGHDNRGGGYNNRGGRGGQGGYRGGQDGGGSYRGGQGGGGGYRGGQGGGGGRGGSGSQGHSKSEVKFQERTCPLYANEPGPPPTQPPPPKGWKNLEIQPDGIIPLPSRAEDNLALKNYNSQVTIRLNHFPLTIKFPENLYHYRVDFERVKDEASGPPKQDPKKKPKGKKGGGGGGAQGSSPALSRFPTDLKKKIMKTVLNQMWRDFGREYGIISDFSHSMYTVKRLEDSKLPLDIQVEGADVAEEETGGRFLVKISATAEQVNTENLAFDINNLRGQVVTAELKVLEHIYSVLMRCVHINRYTPMRRADLVDYSVPPHPLGGGVVSFPGYSTLLPLANGWKPFLNIEIANLATYLNGNVLDVIKDVIRSHPGDITRWQPREFDAVNDLLKTCKVSYPNPSHTGIIWTKVVVQLCRKPVSEITFEDDGRKTTVWDYFTGKHGVHLQYKNGPCLECKGGVKPKIPAEICTLKSGQSFNRKLDDQQVKQMAEKARLKPFQLEPTISQAVKDLELLTSPLLSSYGVEMLNGGKMHELKARVLTPPEICYGPKLGGANGEKAVIQPVNGVWDIWGLNFQFYKNATVAKWALVNVSGRVWGSVDEEKFWNFAKGMANKAGSRGMQFPKPISYVDLNLQDFAERRAENVKRLTEVFGNIKQAFGEEKRAFVLVAVPKKGCQVYNHVKQAAELEVGILTQCIAGPNINMTDPRRLDDILRNILLKINSKLTHVNHVVLPPPGMDKKCFSIFSYPTIILGADVTHPPPGTTRIQRDQDGNEIEVGPPSFAAITASICRTGMPYMMHIQAQQKAGKGAAEVITGLDVIMKKFLLKFNQFTKTKPLKIIYFRDGVGDGQFQEVLRTEMSAIRRACSTIEKGYEPQITFITVQKRHKTRFFLPSQKGIENAPPGTVVDTDIVHPVETDFYLLSHQGLLGTSRPTRYHVLWDDSDFSMNEIQTMAYFLCYMFVRCNRSVKIPAPTYYAHWAAKRAEILSKGWVEGYYNNIRELNDKLLKREDEFAKIYPMHFV